MVVVEEQEIHPLLVHLKEILVEMAPVMEHLLRQAAAVELQLLDKMVHQAQLQEEQVLLIQSQEVL